MGGVWGLASSGALENLPVEIRGLASGVLQEAYAVGYLIAAIINLYLVPEVSSTWRSLFWTAAGISLFAAVFRALLPESELFVRAKASQAADGISAWRRTVIFCKETKEMLKRHWLLCVYAICLMSGQDNVLSVHLTTKGTDHRIELPRPRISSVHSRPKLLPTQ